MAETETVAEEATGTVAEEATENVAEEVNENIAEEVTESVAKVAETEEVAKRKGSPLLNAAKHRKFANITIRRKKRRTFISRTGAVGILVPSPQKTDEAPEEDDDDEEDEINDDDKEDENNDDDKEDENNDNNDDDNDFEKWFWNNAIFVRNDTL